jgi:hypothetical protein
MIGWLFRWVASQFKAKEKYRERDEIYVPLVLERALTLSPSPPKGEWSPCHLSTMHRFKASMTCPNGHGISLLNHSIRADGRVEPSVVCLASGCSFHRFVWLKGWEFGHIN